MTPLTAQQTVDRAHAVLRTGAAAGLPELLALIETLSTDIFKVNLDELAELIEKDTTVLAKVITVANTLAHNPGIAPVATITQAIHHVGFQRIRSLAVSLMLIENTGGPRNPPEQRDAAAHALASGLFAESCAAQLGTVEPDVAFAAATLRNFGNILLPAVSLEHTRAALDRLKSKPADIAFRGMFGLTPVDLSRRILASARLPDEVARALRECDPSGLGGTATQFDTRLLAVADFGSRLARHALDPGISSEIFASRSRQVARLFDRLLPHACDLIEPAVLQTGERLQAFLRATGVGSLPTRGLVRLRQHVHHFADRRAAAQSAAALPPELPADTAPPQPVAPPPADPATASAASDAPAAATAPTPAAASRSPEEVAASAVPGVPSAPSGPSVPATPASAASPRPAPDLSATLQAWDEVLAGAASFGSQPVAAAVPTLATTLALARDAVHAEECWLFQQLPGGTSLSLTVGTGTAWHRAQASAAIRPTDRSVFGVCLARAEVVVLHDTADPVITPYLPEWWLSLDRPPRAFALVPLRVRDAVVGLALIGWFTPRRVAITASEVNLVQQLCCPALETRAPSATLAA